MADGTDEPDRPPVPGPPYSDEQLQAAVDALADAERFREAEDVVAAAAPGLQRVLAEALASGGWFEDGHQGEILKVASNPDSEQRLQALRVLIAEETRIAMMIGVAVGWSLSRELSPQPDIDKED
jgi:hypothetical protein